jgi:hypothetical protein
MIDEWGRRMNEEWGDEENETATVLSDCIFSWLVRN